LCVCAARSAFYSIDSQIDYLHLNPPGMARTTEALLSPFWRNYMRDYLLIYINGKRYEIRGETAFSSLADFLRSELGLVGTKVVCAEGDCGACTVLVGRIDGNGFRYETVDSCIQFLYQLDCKHVVTVEGLKRDGAPHPVQQALALHHGSQCGFCTPGFVMALAGSFEEKLPVDEESMRLSLTGNLCRCTGYLQILEAGLALDAKKMVTLAQQYSSEAMMEDVRRHAPEPVLIAGWRTFFGPRQLEAALEFKARHPEARIVSGATELGVLRNKKDLDPPLLFSLTSLPGLGEINRENGTLTIGANVTWTQIERYMKEALPEFYKIVIRFGSPQIRNVATLVANIAHGSPIADSLPLLLITDAQLELAHQNGTRRVRINDFYKGYKTTDLAPGEIITHVLIPLPAADELLKLYKASKRNDLDIATFGAGIRVKKACGIITRAFIAYSGVAPTVVRLPSTEAFLQGKPFCEETFQQAGREARREIQPISDVRGSRDFRLQLAENILRKFFYDCAGAELEEAETVR
jgi:xanthine dehydrogenase small subunit